MWSLLHLMLEGQSAPVLPACTGSLRRVPSHRGVLRGLKIGWYVEGTPLHFWGTKGGSTHHPSPH